MSLAFSIAPASDVPIFRQIIYQVYRAIATGRLQVGEQLPAVRTLAEELVLNPNTVARSYQELIREGVLESRSGRGVFVVGLGRNFSKGDRALRLRPTADQLCHEGLLAGADLTEIRGVLEDAWKELQREARIIERPDERKKK